VMGAKAMTDRPDKTGGCAPLPVFHCDNLQGSTSVRSAFAHWSLVLNTVVVVQWIPEHTHIGNNTKGFDSPLGPLVDCQHVSARGITTNDFPRTEGRSCARSLLRIIIFLDRQQTDAHWQLEAVQSAWCRPLCTYGEIEAGSCI